MESLCGEPKEKSWDGDRGQVINRLCPCGMEGYDTFNDFRKFITQTTAQTDGTA
jgi:hypothetical protein